MMGMKIERGRAGGDKGSAGNAAGEAREMGMKLLGRHRR